MNIWLWIHKKIEKSIRARDNCNEIEKYHGLGGGMRKDAPVCVEDDSPNHTNVIAMKMYPAIGGYMLEFMHYDNKQDRQKIERHIISDSGDITTHTRLGPND